MVLFAGGPVVVYAAPGLCVAIEQLASPVSGFLDYTNAPAGSWAGFRDFYCSCASGTCANN